MIPPPVSYSHRVLPSGNMILLCEYIFIFPSPACNKFILFQIIWKKIVVIASVYCCFLFPLYIIRPNYISDVILCDIVCVLLVAGICFLY